MIQTLAIAAIRIDGDTQARVELDSKYVRELMDDLEKGSNVPPLLVFHDGSDYWLADGFHRWHAFKGADVGDPRCEVRMGTVEDARREAMHHNLTHGKRLTLNDRRNNIKRAFAEPSMNTWSDHKLADWCGVSHMTVAKYRKPGDEPDVRVGKDGKRRALKKKKPAGKASDYDPDAKNPVDELGQEITDPKIMLAFMDDSLLEFGRAIGRLIREWKKLRDKPVAKFANKDGIEVDLKNAQHAVRTSLPYSLAPAEATKHARFRCGWMTKDDYERIPK